MSHSDTAKNKISLDSQKQTWNIWMHPVGQAEQTRSATVPAYLVLEQEKGQFA